MLYALCSDLVYKKTVNVIENITDSYGRTMELVAVIKVFLNEKVIIAGLA